MPATSLLAIGARVRAVAAREREQPLRQRRRALGAVIAASTKPSNLGLAARQLALQEIEGADDDREHIVEVMGDAAGELAHRLHLLDLAELLLDLRAGEDFVENALLERVVQNL